MSEESTSDLSFVSTKELMIELQNRSEVAFIALILHAPTEVDDEGETSHVLITKGGFMEVLGFVDCCKVDLIEAMRSEKSS